MTTLALDSVLPKPGDTLRLTYTLTESGANFVRVWLVDCPPNSLHYARLVVSEAPVVMQRVVLHEGTGDTSDRKTFVGDKGGRYLLVAQEYKRGESYGSRFEGDTSGGGEGSEVLLGAEVPIAIEVAQTAVTKIGPSAHQADLRLLIVGETVKRAFLENGSSPRAKQAIRTTAVEAARAALEGVSVTTLLGTVETILTEMVNKWTAHIGSASHSTLDTVNTVSTSFKNPKTPKAQVDALNRLLRVATAHIMNDSGAGVGSASPAYHAAAGADTLAYASIGDVGQLLAGTADFFRVYESHRVNATAHAGGADTTNTLTALPGLLALFATYLAEVSKVTPVIPASQNPGIARLIAAGGFTEA